MRWVSLLLAVGACFNPHYQDPTCGPGGACPSGLSCVEGVCRAPGGTDAATVDEDSTTADAATDAATDAVPGSQTLTFQQGVGGYTLTSDTYLDAGLPTSARGGDNNVRWRFDATKQRVGLLRFDGLFGAAAIPTGATIVSATLTVFVENNNSTASVGEVAIPWDAATVTYNTFGSAPGVDSSDVTGADLGTAPTTLGSHTIDVTSSLQRWSADPNTNHGWIFIATAGGGDGVISSSESLTMSQHPQLSVTYTP